MLACPLGNDNLISFNMWSVASGLLHLKFSIYLCKFAISVQSPPSSITGLQTFREIKKIKIEIAAEDEQTHANEMRS